MRLFSQPKLSPTIQKIRKQTKLRKPLFSKTCSKTKTKLRIKIFTILKTTKSFSTVLQLVSLLKDKPVKLKPWQYQLLKQIGLGQNQSPKAVASRWFAMFLGKQLEHRNAGGLITESQKHYFWKGLQGLYLYVVNFGENKTINPQNTIKTLGLSGGLVLYALKETQNKFGLNLTLRTICKQLSPCLNRLALSYLFETEFSKKLTDQFFENMIRQKRFLNKTEKALAFSFNTNNTWIAKNYPVLTYYLRKDKRLSLAQAKS